MVLDEDPIGEPDAGCLDSYVPEYLKDVVAIAVALVMLVALPVGGGMYCHVRKESCHATP